MEILIDVPNGEKLGFAVTVLCHLIKTYPGAKIIFFYNIVCKLLSHLNAHGVEIRPYLALVPILHIPVHGSCFQVAVGPKLSLGSGTIDGEVIERLWSDLEYHAGYLKRMTWENQKQDFPLSMEKAIHIVLPQIDGIRSTLLSMESEPLKSYAETVAHNYQIQWSAFSSNIDDFFDSSELSGIQFVLAKAPHVQNEVLEMWSRISTLAMEFNEEFNSLPNIMDKDSNITTDTNVEQEPQLDGDIVTEFSKQEELVFAKVQAQMIVETLKGMLDVMYVHIT
ncbi:hypothetical protein BCR33DRAFT_793714 [Rhizoclosmatium globosum]|uniref:Uncharacterized protein n=1 Tax=Rhizoclosmatium globosum TaxID=329046 RepID=A0A1Y2B0X0_9FUNG|nr:hypothetical protein BCR33DRAFT_793714 [Rhizoclosmatium globosum]|eukprot:ORY27725.1 hypothetical protein BCR33DRAFT_793714 [Rhizoclosmatium globosum]